MDGMNRPYQSLVGGGRRGGTLSVAPPHAPLPLFLVGVGRATAPGLLLMACLKNNTNLVGIGGGE